MKDLVSLANKLDQKGLEKEADILDNFVKNAGFLVDISAWAAGRMDADTLAGIAGQLPAEKLAEAAKLMDEDKRKQVIRILVADPVMQAAAAEALGLPPGMAQAGLGALQELQQMGGGRTGFDDNLGGAMPTLEELKKLNFG